MTAPETALAEKSFAKSYFPPTRLAVSGLFLLNGTFAGAWAPKIPEFASRLGLSEGELGLMIMCFGIGSLILMPIAGILIAHYGTTRTVKGATILFLTTMVLLSLTPTIPLGAIAIFSVVVFLRETTIPDKNLIRPRRLLSAYGTLLTEPRFLLAALVLGGSIGALYAQATMLTFILINKVGMTPTAFGIGMLMQTGAYFFGSIALRYIAPQLGDRRSVVLGLCFSGTGGLLILLSVFLIPPSFLSIMGPVAVATVGIALLTPSMVTAALAPFPHIAGSASAMMCFIQMGSGFTGGAAASFIGSPLTGFGIIIPVMEFTAIASYIGFRIVSRRET